MEEILIKRAEASDAPYIQEKLVNYILDKTDADWSKFFVAKSGSKTVSFGRVIDHGDYFEIASVGVDYYHRKKGIGVKMLNFLKEEARKQDPNKGIYCVTHRPGFLSKVGFQEIPEGPRALEDKKHNKCILPPDKIKIMKIPSKGKDG